MSIGLAILACSRSSAKPASRLVCAASRLWPGRSRSTGYRVSIGVRDVSGKLKTSPEQLSERVDQLLDRSRALEKELERLKGKLASAAGSDLASQAVDIDGIKLIVGQSGGCGPEQPARYG
jgi:hypothetical protein